MFDVIERVVRRSGAKLYDAAKRMCEFIRDTEETKSRPHIVFVVLLA